MSAISALSQDFEGTDGATATAGSIGAASITGTAPTFSAADPQQGTTALQNAVTGTNQSNIRYDFTPVALAWVSFYFKTPSVAPGSNQTIANWFGATNATNIGALRLGSDMSLTIRDGVSGVFTSPPLPVNTWIRIAVKVAPAPSTGTQQLKIYIGTNRHGSTPDVGYDSGAVSCTSTTLTTVDTFHIGAITGGAMTVFYDRMRGDNATEPAGVSVGGPPTGVSAGPDLTKEVGGSSFTITGTATAAAGASIASRAWTILSGVTVTLAGTTTATVTVTPPAGTGSTVLRFTATDNTGQSTSDDVTLTWVAAGVALHPVADVSNPGAYTAFPAASPIATNIDDVVLDTTDYIASTQAPTAAVYRTRLTSVPTPSITTGWYLSVNAKVLPDVVTNSVVFKLYEADGTTLRKTWSAITDWTTTDTERQLTLTSGEVATITTWSSGLIIEMSTTLT